MRNREEYERLFYGMTIEQVRHLWDTVDDTSFSGPYDCADIHAWLNMMGDGAYCAV